MEINFGLDVAKQEMEQNLPEKHLMGGFGTIEYPDLITEHPYWLPTWSQISPETQFGANVETMGCTGYGTNNILEMIWKFQYGLDINISDRGVNKMSGTTANGNTVDAPIDTIRNKGYLYESEYGWDRKTFSWADYYQSIPQSLLDKAKTRSKDSPTREWEFQHEYVPNNPEAIKQALKTSPLGGTVAAWHKGDDGIYRNMGYGINHWTVAIIDYKEGEYWLCADSYPEDYNMADNPQQPEFLKKLAWDYQFGCIKRYKIVDVRKEKPLTFNNKIVNMIKDIWCWFETTGKPKGLRAYYVPRDNKGVIKGKQEIKFDSLNEIIKAVKILFSAMLSIGMFKKTSWGEISSIDDKTFVE
jgi:hypothetical protein